MAATNYLIIERFRNGDAVPVYRRFRDLGRLMPEGIEYITSWITADVSVCYQVMATENRELLDEWIANWSDIVDFEVIPVISSAEAAARTKI